MCRIRRCRLLAGLVGAIWLLPVTLDAQAGRAVKADSADTMAAVEEEDLSARLAVARTFGGRIIGQAEIAKAVSSARTLADLLRRAGGSAVDVVPTSGFQNCFAVSRAARGGRQVECATLLIDDVPVAPDAYVSPRDIAFVVVLSVPAAMARLGQRGRTGAILVYTWGTGLPRG
jgi:hypothetical protein